MWNALKQLFANKPEHDPELENARQKMAVDQQEAGKRYVACVLATNHAVDPAYRAQMARTAVSEWYGIKSREQLLERIEDYIEGKMSTPAYDAYRATFLARAGLPAGYLGVDESWQLSLRAAQRVQQTYDGWLAYGMGFLQGHLDYRKGCGDDAAKLADNRKDMLQHLNGLSQGIWSTTQFRTPLLPS